MEPFHKAKRALITRTKAFAIGPVIGNSQGKKDQMRQNDLQSKACAVCAASMFIKEYFEAMQLSFAQLNESF